MSASATQNCSELCVVVLNYRTPDLVVDCLASLEPEVAPHVGRCVVVVDNASGDDSQAKIGDALRVRGWKRWASLVVSPSNGGFAAGNRLGMRSVAAHQYLLLNSDTLVRAGALDALLSAAAAHPTAAAIGCRIEGADGVVQASCFRFLTPMTEFLRSARTHRLFRLLARFAVVAPYPTQSAPVEWVSFAAVLLRASALSRVQLDEGYFMYFEDVDFCRKAWQAGFEVRHEPAARVVHLEGASSQLPRSRSERGRLPAYYYAARSRYFARWYGRGVGPLLANCAWLAGRCVSWLRELVLHEEPACAECEARDLWRDWLTSPRSRRA